MNGYYSNNRESFPVSIGDWIITMIITGIPLIGFIMLFVWAFGSDTPPSKANWAKATLILYLVVFVVFLIFFFSFGLFFLESVKNIYNV